MKIFEDFYPYHKHFVILATKPTQISAPFGNRLERKTGPFGARFIAKTQGIRMVSAVFGALKGLHFGSLLESFWTPKSGPLWTKKISGFLQNMNSKSMNELMIFKEMQRAYFRPLKVSQLRFLAGKSS